MTINEDLFIANVYLTIVNRQSEIVN